MNGHMNTRVHEVISFACFLCSNSTVQQGVYMHACMWQKKFHLPGAFASTCGRSAVLKAGTCGHAFHHCWWVIPWAQPWLLHTSSTCQHMCHYYICITIYALLYMHYYICIIIHFHALTSCTWLCAQPWLLHASSTCHQMYSISPYMHHYTCSLTCIHWHTCTVVHALHMSSFLCPALTAAHDHYVPPNTSLLVETLAHCIRSHITTAHSVIMLVSSHKHSHHNYSPMLTHMRDSHYHSMHDKDPFCH